MPAPERRLPIAGTEPGLSSLPENLESHRVKPGFLHNENDEFDVICSWSDFLGMQTCVSSMMLLICEIKNLKPGVVIFI
jgi:hypothetical protein